MLRQRGRGLGPSSASSDDVVESEMSSKEAQINGEPKKTMTKSASRDETPSGKFANGEQEERLMDPLMIDGKTRDVPMGNGLASVPSASSPAEESSSLTGACDAFFARHCASNPEFFKQCFKFLMCFCGLQASYLTWGYMQELIMTTQFSPTPNVPSGKFPSAAFCVFSNRFLAVIVAMIAVRIKHGSVFSNNKAPLWAFTPCAISNTMSSWSQYASLKYVSFPVQTIFKSSKIIPVMMMGRFLKGTEYPCAQYIEAALITFGVAVFSLSSKSSDEDKTTELLGLVFLLCYISFDSFTSQWQDKVYTQYGRENVDPYQMMLGVNTSAIAITTAGLLVTGDFLVVWEFLNENPHALYYNIITAITSASGQLCIFYTIKEFGPIVFTIIMTTRQMISICISAVVFGHAISITAVFGAIIVFSVLFYQIRRKYNARKKTAPGGGSSAAGEKSGSAGGTVAKPAAGAGSGAITTPRNGAAR